MSATRVQSVSAVLYAVMCAVGDDRASDLEADALAEAILDGDFDIEATPGIYVRIAREIDRELSAREPVYTPEASEPGAGKDEKGERES